MRAFLKLKGHLRAIGRRILHLNPRRLRAVSLVVAFQPLLLQTRDAVASSAFIGTVSSLLLYATCSGRHSCRVGLLYWFWTAGGLFKLKADLSACVIASYRVLRLFLFSLQLTQVKFFDKDWSWRQHLPYLRQLIGMGRIFWPTFLTL